MQVPRLNVKTGNLNPLCFKKNSQAQPSEVLGSNMVSSDTKLAVGFTVYMRREGKVTVPKELRDAYDLKEGDLVECQIRKIK